RCQPAGPLRPYLVARACTLAPASAEKWTQPFDLSRGELWRNQTEFWALTQGGALRFRMQITRDAVGFLERSLVVDGRPGRAVLNWLWLSLGHQQLGSPSEARRWLRRAANWLDQQGSQMPGEYGVVGAHRHNWLEAHVLRREAEARLR